MKATTIGIDLAKTVFQVHGINEQHEVVLTRRLRRKQVIAFFAKLEPCLVGMEACATSHHWARELIKLGHDRSADPTALCEGVCQASKE